MNLTIGITHNVKKTKSVNNEQKVGMFLPGFTQLEIPEY